MYKVLLAGIASMLFGSMAPAQDAVLGEKAYMRYCVTCHGIDATGHGPMRPVLLVQPADLTRLAAGNNGRFPLERVLRRIDGRDPLVSHGSEMPIYGGVFDGSETVVQLEGSPAFAVSEVLADLLMYLVSVQAE